MYILLLLIIKWVKTREASASNNIRKTKKSSKNMKSGSERRMKIADLNDSRREKRMLLM